MARLVAKFGDWVDVDRPASEVFARASDLEALFAALHERAGVEAKRLTGAGPTAVGDRWRVKGAGRLKRRKGVAEVTALDAPERMAVRAEGGGYVVDNDMRVQALDARRCRIEVRSAVHASGLKAIVAAAALKLLKRRVQAGMRKGLLKAKAALEG